MKMKEKITCAICGFRFENQTKALVVEHKCKLKDKFIYACIKPRDSIVQFIFQLMSFYLWFETGNWFYLLLVFGGSFVNGYLKGWFKLG